VEHNRVQFYKRSYFYSFCLHVSLFLLMWNIPVLFHVEVPQFYELNLGAVSQQRVAEIIEEARRSKSARYLQEQGLTPEERVEVPKRKMIEIEEPTISVPTEQRIESQDIITGAERQKFDINAPEFELPATDDTIFPTDRKEIFQGSQITIGEEPGTGIETGTIGADLIFTIEGEIKGRDILSNPLPEYPEGHNKNAVIKIRFIVLPNGSVSSSDMIPIRKEDSVLEELTMNTLKLWRFSPLPTGETKKQTGIITFNYKIE